MRSTLSLSCLAFSLLAQSPAGSSSSPSLVVRPCAACHPAQAKPQPQTSMAHAMELPAQCNILKDNPSLTFKEGRYSYRIARQGDASIYTVTDGSETISVPIGWAFGLGLAGQTYVFEKDGTLYQSRVSFYRSLKGLDLTIGAANVEPTGILQAAGRAIDHAEGLRCFGCHATASAINSTLNLGGLTPGVQCERCHGLTQDHLKGLQTANPALARMKDLREMSSEDTSNFCGQCHRTWADVAGAGVLGIANIRFQPYRLTNSKCYDADDNRIRCTACHDPHTELNTADVSYDARCQACHAARKPAARPCRVATANCVSCHMPKLEMPGSHHKFTDHNIRIVKAHETYPN